AFLDINASLLKRYAALASVDDGGPTNKASDILRQLLEESDEVRSILRNSLYNWTIALPRAIQESDSKQREHALQRVSYGFKSLNEMNITQDLLDTTLANSICDAAAILMQSLARSHRVETLPVEVDLKALQGSRNVSTVTPIIAESGDSVLFSSDLQRLIQQICNNDKSLTFAQTMLDRTLSAPREFILEPYWVLVMMLRTTVPEEYKYAEFLTDVCTDSTAELWSTLVDDLYSFSLPILTEFSPIGEFDWRVPSLALEVVALQALQLGSRFATELIDVLYPILQVLTTSNPMLRRHAHDCLSVIVSSCGYQSASELLISNVDYLVNAVSFKLNAFDVSPQAPRVLLLMIQLCGPNLIPFLDDIVVSIFAILDAYHGYPKLAEVMFSVLGAIVSKGSEASDQLVLTDSTDTPDAAELRPSYQGRSLGDLVQSIERRRKRLDDVTKIDHVEEDQGADGPQQPLGPLSSDMLNGKKENDEEENFEYHEEEDTEMLPPPQEEKKELTASHQLLLNIVKCIPQHMTSPSPLLRKSLLEIMKDSIAFLSKHEDTFLPLINDLWPTVSARMSLPASFTGHEFPITANEGDVAKRPNIDESGISEETYVFVDTCSTIDTMIRTAKNFMAKRLEDEFPRWKKMYAQVWMEVKNDAERKKKQHRELSKTALVGEVIFKKDVLASNDYNRQVEKEKGEISPYFVPPTGRMFTPHHTIWQSFNELFATMLKYLRLSDEMSWEICYMLGESMAYFKPDHYSSGNWHRLRDHSDRVVYAMNHYNKDLTWYIFEKARRGNEAAGEKHNPYMEARERMNKRLLGSFQNAASGSCPSRWTFGVFES
ncbi:hypothetical protein KEM56_000739, partial [Ascosphaera pollenicola]